MREGVKRRTTHSSPLHQTERSSTFAQELHTRHHIHHPPNPPHPPNVRTPLNSPYPPTNPPQHQPLPPQPNPKKWETPSLFSAAAAASPAARRPAPAHPTASPCARPGWACPSAASLRAAPTGCVACMIWIGVGGRGRVAWGGMEGSRAGVRRLGMRRGSWLGGSVGWG
jgi:hypothetical protein